jgi:methionine-S-sulfoxide reductase
MSSKIPNTEIAVLAGGCFWGLEELFRNLKGVTNTEVGYCGGRAPEAKYEIVKQGRTSHAEAVQIEFDPKVLPFNDLLKFFFRVHNPTTVNQQGNDIGSQYRSVIFAVDENQFAKAKQAIADEQKSGFWQKPIVTDVQIGFPFFAAEDYHQDYLKKNPNGYTCHYYREVAD